MRRLNATGSFRCRVMTMTRYAELDVTTNFSFLRGGSHPEELVATAKALGLDAIAVTDRNTLAGVVRAHLAAKEVGGIKFVVGVHLDLKNAPSLLAYPTNRAAYGRLCRLLTLGQRRAEKGECILYLDDVAAHAEGLIFIILPPDDWIVSHPSRRRFAPPQGEGKKIFAFSNPHAEERPKDAFRSMQSKSPESDLTHLRELLAAPLYLAARHS